MNVILSPAKDLPNSSNKLNDTLESRAIQNYKISALSERNVGRKRALNISPVPSGRPVYRKKRHEKSNSSIGATCNALSINYNYHPSKAHRQCYLASRPLRC